MSKNWEMFSKFCGLLRIFIDLQSLSLLIHLSHQYLTNVNLAIDDLAVKPKDTIYTKLALMP